MKRIIALALLLALLLVSSASFAADIDLSSMGFEELVALKDQIDKAIWECEEWQEVTVPQGVYVVGRDIPAGHWTIRPVNGQWATVHWGDVIDESGRGLASGGKIREHEMLTSPTNRSYKDGDKTQVDYEVKEGHYIIIDNGDMVFSPYTGTPALGFK